jgi:hypothetical protein
MEDQTLPTEEEIAAVLSPEDDELKQLFADEGHRKIALKMYPLLADRFNQAAEAKAAKKTEKFIAELTEENKKLMTAEVAKLRKANEPLTPEELGKLLSQEYLEFTLKLRERKGKQRECVIRELPIAVELKLLKVLKKTMASITKEVASFDWTAGLSNLEKVEKLIDMMPDAVEALAECCAVCLDPDKEEAIDQKWVLANLDINRMYLVLEAQATVSRWRDFFSRVYQSIPQQMIA